MATVTVDVEISVVCDDGEHLSGSGYFDMDLPEGVYASSGGLSAQDVEALLGAGPSLGREFESGLAEAMEDAVRGLRCEIEAAAEKQPRGGK